MKRGVGKRLLLSGVWCWKATGKARESGESTTRPIFADSECARTKIASPGKVASAPWFALGPVRKQQQQQQQRRLLPELRATSWQAGDKGRLGSTKRQTNLLTGDGSSSSWARSKLKAKWQQRTRHDFRSEWVLKC